MKTILVHYLLFTICFLVFTPNIFGTEDIAKQFLMEAPVSWEKLKYFQQGLEGTYQEEMVDLSTGNWKYRVDGEFKCIDSNKYLHYKLTNSKGGAYETIFCFNTKYGFILDRKYSTDIWRIDNLEKNKKMVLDRFERQGAILDASCTIEAQSLSWIVRQPGFKLKNAHKLDKAGKGLVEVNFETSNYLFNDRKILGGKVIIDPSNFWAVQDYEIQILCNVKSTVKGSVEYVEQLDGFPIPLRTIREYRDGKDRSQLTVNFKNLRKCSAQAHDFTLSAFDLPEPGKPSKGGSQRWVWLVSLALICLVAASLIRFRSRMVR